MREPAHETHVLVRTGLLRPSGLRQFFEVPNSVKSIIYSGLPTIGIEQAHHGASPLNAYI